MSSLLTLGFWHNNDSPELPDPRLFVDRSWAAEERAAVAAYLRAGIMIAASGGFSRCRICREQNGCLTLTDGTWVWPEGLAHYVAVHRVRLPPAFIDRATSGQPPGPVPALSPFPHIDYSVWMSWAVSCSTLSG